MIDLKRIENDRKNIEVQLSKRKFEVTLLDEVLDLEAQRKKNIQEVEVKKAKRNAVSKEIGKRKREGEDITDILKETDNLGEEIKQLDEQRKKTEEDLQNKLLSIPNIPSANVPEGFDEEDNIEIKVVGEKPSFSFEAKPHWEYMEKLGVDVERATKISGSRFIVTRGFIAKLERALQNFMLDENTKRGYEEIRVPLIVNEDSMIGTGQFPKFEEDAFKISNDDRNLILIPTTEVPLVNLHRNEFLDNQQLPISYTGYSSAFRREAGSAGRDTRGLIRLHEFIKVELVQFTKPEESYKALEKMLSDAENILQKLELPYRVITLCGGDLGFAAAQTYDIEVWMPGVQTYREISSVSNTEDFQARRANIKFKRTKDSKAEYVHTLNGTSLAITRTVAAIIENYQNEDGTVRIPKALESYMN